MVTTKKIKQDAVVPADAKESSKEGSNRGYQVIVRPVITEKSTHLSADNKYVFEVSDDANKIEIIKAIKAIYGVSPIKVNILNIKGKLVTRGRQTGRRKDLKKAVVTLAKGQSITIHEGV